MSEHRRILTYNSYEIFKKLEMGENLTSCAYLKLEDGFYAHAKWETSADLAIEADCEQQAAKKIIVALDYHHGCKTNPLMLDTDGNEVIYVFTREAKQKKAKWQWIRKNRLAKV